MELVSATHTSDLLFFSWTYIDTQHGSIVVKNPTGSFSNFFIRSNINHKRCPLFHVHLSPIVRWNVAGVFTEGTEYSAYYTVVCFNSSLGTEIPKVILLCWLRFYFDILLKVRSLYLWSSEFGHSLETTNNTLYFVHVLVQKKIRSFENYFDTLLNFQNLKKLPLNTLTCNQKQCYRVICTSFVPFRTTKTFSFKFRFIHTEKTSWKIRSSTFEVWLVPTLPN